MVYNSERGHEESSFRIKGENESVWYISKNTAKVGGYRIVLCNNSSHAEQSYHERYSLAGKNRV